MINNNFFSIFEFTYEIYYLWKLHMKIHYLQDDLILLYLVSFQSAVNIEY